MSVVATALTPHVDRGEVAGLVAVVGRGADLEVTVLGDRSVGGPPMSEDSLFRIASAGKPITAAAALALVADRRVRLDDPVDDLVPELAGPRVLRDPAGPLDDTVPVVRPITLRDLLRSTNGLGFSSDFSSPIASVVTEQLHQGSWGLKDESPDDSIRAGRCDAAAPPTRRGLHLQHRVRHPRRVRSRASGLPFSRYTDERILGPLGMSDTGFAFPAGSDDRITTLYRAGDDGELVATDEPDAGSAVEPAFASGAGGHVSTAADLVRFQQMLLDVGGGLLPPDLVTAMTTDQLTPAIRATDSIFLDGQSWGYGGGVDVVVRNPWNVIGRYGWVGGTGTSAYIVPSDGSIAVLLTQTELGGPSGAAVLESFWAAAATELGHDG